jgi:hypothetical protein
MRKQQPIDTHRKALSINLEASIFGSFAEIGAGQEVARWFLRVGGASGTVAKSISAYDKEISDHLYGSGTRYVSRDRLQAMLDREWEELLDQLQSTRGAQTRFFAFVDTIMARNFAGTNLPHGWLGLRFQDQPGGSPNEVILHVNLLDASSVQQQEAIGVLGVNLLYAVCHQLETPETFLNGLAEAVIPHRLEIDYIQLHGPIFDNDVSNQWDARRIHTLLIAKRFAQGVIFEAGESFSPLVEVLHKKSVVLAPGVFEKTSSYHSEMMASAIQELRSENRDLKGTPLGLFCITVPPSSWEQSSRDFSELMSRIEALHNLGYGVLLFPDREIYKLSANMQRITSLPIRIVVGISVLLRVFQDDYPHLGGNTLRAVSLLFSQNVRVYAYPMPSLAFQEWIKKLGANEWGWKDTAGIVFANFLKPPGPLRQLYEYLLGSHFIVPLQLDQAHVRPTEPSGAIVDPV